MTPAATRYAAQSAIARVGRAKEMLRQAEQAAIAAIREFEAAHGYRGLGIETARSTIAAEVSRAGAGRVAV